MGLKGSRLSVKISAKDKQNKITHLALAHPINKSNSNTQSTDACVHSYHDITVRRNTILLVLRITRIRTEPCKHTKRYRSF